MSTTDKTLDLRGLTGSPLCCAVNEAIARHVLHREVDEDGFMRGDDDKLGDRTFESWRDIPLFSSSADAVLPLLTIAFIRYRYYNDDGRFSGDTIGGTFTACGEFALGACIALLRANGVIVLV